MTDQTTRLPVRRALISVSDKTGVVDFARELAALGVEILSTGGTFKLLSENGIAAVEVADYTGFPEMMDGRVKTLHPKIHGGILGRRDLDGAVMSEHGIRPIDLVAVNLYPFAATVAKPGCTLPDAIENIDIGGPTMVRSAAKNHKDVAIVVNADDYAGVVANLKSGGLTYAQRFDLALKAFEHTAAYDGMIANYLGGIDQAAETLTTEGRSLFPRTYNMQFIKAQDMRYGENPHQQAAFYVEKPEEACVATAKQLQGKELSFNNVADTDAALECVKSFTKPACVIVKHANPCGVAVSTSILDAYDRAYKTDPTSAFGGIIAFNRELDAETAQAIISRQFVEVIIAPSASEEALKITAAKQNVRVLVCGQWAERVPGLDFDKNYATAVLGARMDLFGLRSSAEYTETADDGSTSRKRQTTANRYSGSAGSALQLGEHRQLTATVRYERDDFATYDRLGTFGLGYGTRLIDGERVTLDTQIGPGVRRTHNSETDENRTGLIGRGLFDFKFGITDNTELVNSLLVESGSYNTFAQNDFGVSVNMNQHFALKAGRQARYNSDVSDQKRKTDTLSTMNVVYSFK